MPSTSHPPSQPPPHRSAPEPPSRVRQTRAALIASVFVGIATTGYFLGLTSPMANHPQTAMVTQTVLEPGTHSSQVIPATSYAQMAHRARPSGPPAPLAELRPKPYDSFSLLPVDTQEKPLSLVHRATRRAYDGAPPTIPHPVDQRSAVACMACHGEGLRSPSLRAGKLPHPYYANCTQCHVEQEATALRASAAHENTFAGLPAPTSGARAWPGAPPVIPHSLWMRNDCLSCHGRTASTGLESSHPWRSQCLQCHAESSSLGAPLDQPPFLPAPPVSERHE